MIKIYLVEHYHKVSNYLRDILVFESLEQAENYVAENKTQNDKFVVFERTIEKLTEQQLNEIREFKCLDDFDYTFGNFENDKFLFKL